MFFGNRIKLIEMHIVKSFRNINPLGHSAKLQQQTQKPVNPISGNKWNNRLMELLLEGMQK